MRTNSSQKSVKKWYFKNENIRALTLRVIDQEGKQIGIMTRDEAIGRARDDDKDLILITDATNPPIAKIIDFSKFLYQEKKKDQEAKKGAKKSSTKDVQLSVFIAAGDLGRLQKKAQNFIDSGYQVRVKLMLKGREMAKKEMAFGLINNFVASLSEVNVAAPTRMVGRVVFVILTRKKKHEKTKAKN